MVTSRQDRFKVRPIESIQTYSHHNGQKRDREKERERVVKSLVNIREKSSGVTTEPQPLAFHLICAPDRLCKYSLTKSAQGCLVSTSGATNRNQ